MKKTISVIGLTLMLQGCLTVPELTVAGAAVTTLICNTTTVDGRAKIREGQSIETDICGDLKGEQE